MKRTTGARLLVIVVVVAATLLFCDRDSSQRAQTKQTPDELLRSYPIDTLRTDASPKMEQASRIYYTLDSIGRAAPGTKLASNVYFYKFSEDLWGGGDCDLIYLSRSGENTIKLRFQYYSHTKNITLTEIDEVLDLYIENPDRVSHLVIGSIPHYELDVVLDGSELWYRIVGDLYVVANKYQKSKTTEKSQSRERSRGPSAQSSTRSESTDGSSSNSPSLCLPPGLHWSARLNYVNRLLGNVLAKQPNLSDDSVGVYAAFFTKQPDKTFGYESLCYMASFDETVVGEPRLVGFTMFTNTRMAGVIADLTIQYGNPSTSDAESTIWHDNDGNIILVHEEQGITAIHYETERLHKLDDE